MNAATLAPPDSDQRMLLSGISWKTYEQLLEALGESNVRMTYDRGNLEIMTLSRKHESNKSLIARMLETLAYEFDIPMEGIGSITCRREDLEKGLEPDECFYIAHERQMRDKEEVDFSSDPPPDLAIEIDITSHYLDQQSIYAALGVPELWSFDRKALRVFHLMENGNYELRDTSLSFPFLPLGEFERILLSRSKPGHGVHEVMKEFHAFVNTLKRP